MALVSLSFTGLDRLAKAYYFQPLPFLPELAKLDHFEIITIFLVQGSIFKLGQDDFLELKILVVILNPRLLELPVDQKDFQAS